MKFIYYTNNTIYGLTLLGYLTIILGLYMQILLGVIQILFFLVLLFNYDKFSKNIKDHLSIYGTTILLYFIFILYMKNNIYPEYGILISILIPMTIGTYFTYIVSQLKQQVL
ncbi:hypothetical protein [uncultured Kordia sp.]|uniref:hypothetical protein n=1 Tax=uncultured Kordia sp. TaxID=507699 RepID=UPI0026171927|nr:hypothetical protein [uncultured Kordia sp.]